MNANLIVWMPGSEPVQYVLNAESVGLGRDPANQIQVKHPSISSVHLELTREPEGEIHLRDLKSSNGVKVNGLPVKQTDLRDGDRILVGGEIGALFLHLPEGADPEERIVSVDKEVPEEFRTYAKLLERKNAADRSLRNRRKRAEGLRHEAAQLKWENRRRWKLCTSLAKEAAKVLQEIRDTQFETPKEGKLRVVSFDPAESGSRATA